tara:strand:+ start:4412 stop:4693 length:282 start_codon:yes stop_codon:yes gene_type:complete
MSRFGDLIKTGAQAPKVEAAPAPEPVVEEVVESPIVDEDTEETIEEETYESDVSLYDMSKKELEEYGRTLGVELDRRRSKESLIEELKEVEGE